LLELPLRDVISGNISKLESMPSVGQRKLETLATILNRIVDSGPTISSLSEAQDDHRSSQHSSSASTFDASQLSEPEWRRWRELVIDQKLLDEPLGRFAKSLRQLPRSTWWTSLGTYCPLTLAQIRSLPAHGPMRVAAILRVFHDLQEATGVRTLHRDRPIARVESWVLDALANYALIEKDAIEARILQPFFEQVASDLGSAAAKVAWAKLRFDAGVATPDQNALLGQYSRGRIYQLARDAGTVGQLRWTAAFDQLERLLDTRRLMSNSIEFRLLDALQGEIARGACSERRSRFSKESATPSRFCTI
jgi:hypothetical protein